MNDIKITVLTPTYNRLPHIKALLQSLVLQTNQNFQWLVIDDGSSDGTKEFFENLDLEKYSFQIEYHYKQNAGKHTALNFAHPYLKGQYVVVVDSDDELTCEAVTIIISSWERYSHMPPPPPTHRVRYDYISKRA